ncbi:hypothetical protein TWF281_000354 [Arthrobotrys megalospora]
MGQTARWSNSGSEIFDEKKKEKKALKIPVQRPCDQDGSLENNRSSRVERIQGSKKGRAGREGGIILVAIAGTVQGPNGRERSGLRASLQVALAGGVIK